MSKTIDEKVVEMRFDNKNFESNVKTTLSTLDKLKAKLNLTGASKGLEEVNKVSKKVDFSHMEESLSALERRFSTAGIVGMTVIQNLTTAAIGFASKLKNVTLGGIFEGGKARATKIENAKFQIKGLLRDAEDADEKLKAIMDDVNYGVESTAYGLDAAATVAAQLVASGMEAGDGMRSALRGISGVAAMTNSTYEDIGRIYTTVAGNGRLMGEQLLQLSSRGMNAAAVLAKSLNTTESEIRSMVSKGQISFEQFSEAMDNAFGEHAKDANNTLNGVLSNIRAALAKIGADFYGPLIAEKSPLVEFLNSVRERINEIRKTLSPITKEVTDRINKFISSLNNLFTNSNILGYNPLSQISNKIKEIKDIINSATEPINNAVNTFNKAGEAVKDYEALVDEIINGKWKNNPDRQRLLEEAGYNFYHAQNMVNERLGNSFRYAEDYVESTDMIIESTNDLAVNIENLSEEQMRNMGYTDEQINAFNELKKMAEKTGIPIKELIELINTKVDKNGNILDDSAFNTRYLIFNSFKNIGLTLVSIFKSVGKALSDVFSISPDSLFDMIAAFHKLTTIIHDKVEKNADKLSRTLRGIFSIIHIITSFIGGGFKLALNVVNKILESFDLSLLDVTAAIGDAIYNFDRWITSNSTFAKVMNAVIEVIVSIIKWIGETLIKVKDIIKQNKGLMTFFTNIKNGFNNIGSAVDSWVQGLKETSNVPKYIIDGLVNGLKNNASKVYETITTIGKGIIEYICNILGIHSPSTIMFAIGGFIIAGLINGIVSGAYSITDVFQGIISKIIDLFKSIDLGQIISIGLMSGIFVTINKIIGMLNILLKPIESLSNVLDGLGSALTGIGSAAKDFGKSMKYSSIASIIKSIGISIALLAGSLYIIGKLKPEEFEQGKKALMGIAIALAALLAVIIIFSDKLSNIQLPDVGKIIAAILAISVGMILMSKALKNIAKIDSDKMGPAIGGLAICAIALGGLLIVLAAVSKKMDAVDESKIKQLGNIFTKISISLLLISVALRIMNKVELGAINKMALVIVGLIGLLVALAAINHFSAGSLNESADILKVVGTTLLLLVITMKIAGSLNNNDFLNGIKVIGVFSLLLIAMLGISKIFKGTEMIKVSGSIILIGITLGILAGVMKIAGEMDQEKADNGIKCIAKLSTILGILMIVTKNYSAKMGLTLMGISTTLIAMGLVVFLLGQLDASTAAKGLVFIGVLSLFVAGLVKVSKDFSSSRYAFKTLIGLTVMIAVLVASLVALTFIDTAKLLSSSAALTLVMLSLAGIIAATKNLKADKNTLVSLVLIGAIIAAAIGAIFLLSKFTTPEDAIKNAAALSLLMMAIAGMMFVMKNMSKGATGLEQLGTSMAILLAVIVAIGALSLILIKMGDTQNAIQNAAALSLLMIAIAGMIGVIALVGKLGPESLIGIISLAAVILAVKVLADILIDMDDLDNAMENVKAISTLMLSLSASLLIISIAGTLGAIAAPGLLALIGTIAILGVFAAGLGALNKYAPDLIKLMNDGLPIIEAVSKSLGRILGNILAGAISSIADELPHLGTKLSEFAVCASPFITIMKTVDEGVANGATALGKSLLMLTGAELLDGITRLLTDGESFGRLGIELSKFAIGALPFITTMSQVDPAIMQGAEALGKAILSFSGANFVDALTTGIFGAESGLDTFGTKLGTLGSGLKDFAGNLGDFSLEDADKIKTAGEALKAISDTAKGLPNEGGWLAKIVGDNDIGTFASKLGGVGSGISEFINSLNENNIDTQSVEVAKNGCEIIRVLTDVAKDLPNTGGILAAFVGDNDLSDFASNLGKVAEGIRGYVWELQKDNVITKDSIPIVKTVNDLLWAISDLGEIDLSSTSGNLEELGARLGSFGNKITEYVKGVNTVKLEDYKKASDKIDSILEIANRLSEGNKYADNINKLGNALEKVGKTSIQKFIDAIKGDTTKENAKDAMKNLLNVIADTIEKQSDETVKPKSEKIGKSVKEGVESTKDKMEKVGKDFIQGFANGIKNNLYIATDAGSLIGKSALNAAKRSIDAHSPSKETYKLGTFFDEGFINGVKSLQNKIYNETYGVGDKARLGLTQAIRGVSNLIENGIDDEITIRPILDLSNIESGAKSINGMFGIPSLQVDSNLGAISYGMKLNSQNGGNDNVVSAIEKLSKNLGNVNGDTYNINGVTYGDADKNISDAVQTLVRAARIERRT